jgi:ribosomal protein S27AE
MSAGDSGKAIEQCRTCGKRLEAFDRYLDCPERMHLPRGDQRQHDPVPLPEPPVKLTYQIITDDKGDPIAIKCLKCGLTSHHPEDVRQRYCGKCHVFHDDLRKRAKIPRFGSL